VRRARSTSSIERFPCGPHVRRGYSLLEVQVAFALLGIGLAGLCPLVVMQLRQVRQLELRLQGNVVQTNPVTGASQTMLQGNTYYIVPWTNVWTQKLTGSGQILTSATKLTGLGKVVTLIKNSCDPGYPPLSATPAPTNTVTIHKLDAPPYSQSATVYVDVTSP
jgi:type II secretory pathway pseudopilin PulG